MTRIRLWNGMPVDAVDCPGAMGILEKAVASRQALAIAFANAHMAYLYSSEPQLRAALDGFGLVCPDGWPVARSAGRVLRTAVPRLSGPAFLPELYAQAAKRGWRVALLVAEDADGVATATKRRHPELEVVLAEALPYYRGLPSEGEVAEWAASHSVACDVVLVGIGCPKQEVFSRILADVWGVPVLAVGQAMQISAGLRPRPPSIVTRTGTEWIWRLAHEPRRLGRRYWQSGIFTMKSLVRR